MKIPTETGSGHRLASLEDYIAMSDDPQTVAHLTLKSLAADPHEAIPAAHALFTLAYVSHELPKLVARFFVEDALQPSAWSASECLVQGRTALRAMYDGQLGLVRCMEHDTLRLTVLDQHIAHELGWSRLELRDGKELYARYAALWQYREGQGWRVRQWLSAVDG